MTDKEKAEKYCRKYPLLSDSNLNFIAKVYRDGLKEGRKEKKEKYEIALRQIITDREKVIEKMENCWNCKFFKEKKYQACIDSKKNNTKCCAFYKWELAE